MAPTYRQMNGSQRASRKALIDQVAGLLTKRKNPGMGRVITKPATFGSRRKKMSGVNYR